MKIVFLLFSFRFPFPVDFFSPVKHKKAHSNHFCVFIYLSFLFVYLSIHLFACVCVCVCMCVCVNACTCMRLITHKHVSLCVR